MVMLQLLRRVDLCRRRRTAVSARRLPERLGVIEARISLARAIEQFLNLRLLIPDDESSSKGAMAALLLGQTFRAAGDDIREESLVCNDVVDPAQVVLELHQG